MGRRWCWLLLLIGENGAYALLVLGEPRLGVGGSVHLRRLPAVTVKAVCPGGEWKDSDLCTWHSLSHLIHPQPKEKGFFIFQQETES